MCCVTHIPGWWKTNHNSLEILISDEISEKEVPVLVRCCTRTHSPTVQILKRSEGSVAIFVLHDAAGRTQMQVKPHIAGTQYAI